MQEEATPIADRQLELSDGNRVEVLIWAPRKVADGEYHCSFKISGLGDGQTRRGVGVDGMQALVLTLQRIGAYLYTSDKHKSGSLTWFGDANLGFPVPEGHEDLIPRPA